MISLQRSKSSNTFHVKAFLIPTSEQREHGIFRALLGIVPGLEERIMNGSPEEIKLVADLVSSYSIAFS